MKTEAIAWVGSDGEAPENLYYELGDAFSQEHLYIDGFDKDGNRCESHKWDGKKYTTIVYGTL